MISTSNLNDWTKLALGKREKYIKSYEAVEDPINPQIVFMTKANSAFPPVTVNVIGNRPVPDTIYIKYHCGRLTGEAAVPVNEYQLLLRKYLASPRVPFPEKYAVVDKSKIKESVMKGAYEALQDMLNDSKVLESTAYTETNEGIEITFSKEELRAFTDMDGVEAIKFLFHCYECDVDPIELADEEEFITVEIPYTHSNLVESEETNYTELSDYQKEVIKDMVQADFECGHTMDFEGALAGMQEDEDLSPVAEAAANYYMELVQMGPAGVMDEIEDNWSDDYKAEYGEREVPVTNSSERDINSCADWYKTSQIESLMYMNKGMTPKEAKKELGIDSSFEYVPTGHLDESVKNKNLKNRKMSESITRKAKEKLNLLNDIVNFAYEYGEDEATSLFKQAFKKVTGDDLIDALNEEEK